MAVSAREARASLLGLLVVLLASSLLADPLPGPLPLAARIAAALLAARLISISIRGLDRPTAGSRLGWPVEALAAVAAGVVGFGTHGLGATALGPAVASAAGCAVGILAVAPIVTSRDVYRLGDRRDAPPRRRVARSGSGWAGRHRISSSSSRAG